MVGVVVSTRYHRRPMSVTLCINAGEENEFTRLVAESQLSKRLSLVPYHLPLNASYPINLLRNLAIDNSKTNHFWLTDLDMWPSGVLVISLSPRRTLRRHSHAARGRLARPKAGNHRARVRDPQSQVRNLPGMHQQVALLLLSPLACSTSSPTPSRRCGDARSGASAVASAPSTGSTTTSSCAGTRSPTMTC